MLGTALADSRTAETQDAHRKQQRAIAHVVGSSIKVQVMLPQVTSWFFWSPFVAGYARSTNRRAPPSSHQPTTT